MSSNNPKKSAVFPPTFHLECSGGDDISPKTPKEFLFWAFVRNVPNPDFHLARVGEDVESYCFADSVADLLMSGRELCWQEVLGPAAELELILGDPSRMSEYISAQRNGRESAEFRIRQAKVWRKRVVAFVEELRETAPEAFEAPKYVIQHVLEWNSAVDDPLGVADLTIANYVREHLRSPYFARETPRE